MYNMYCFVHNIKNSRRNDHFFPAKVSPKSQKSSKKAYFVKICCPKGAGGLCHAPDPDLVAGEVEPLELRQRPAAKGR